jgi:hypothetical protein
VMLARHRVAEDDGRPLQVDGALGPAVVEQRHPRAREAPLLRVVHRLGDLGRNRQLPGQRIPLPVPHPAADLRVGVLRDLGIRIEVEVGIPAIAVDLADAVPALGDIAPEGLRVGRIREDRSHAHDRDGSARVAHERP